MASKTVLQMQFMTDLNKKVKISIPNPKQPINNADVEAAMDLIVQKFVFAFPQGKIVKKIDASLIQTDAATVG